MSSRTILFFGPLPPPVHGFSEINKRMLARLQLNSKVEVFDVSPSVGGCLYYLKLLIRFFRKALKLKDSALYLPLSGGLRQFIDVSFAGLAIVCGLNIFIHHHSFAYINQKPLYARIVLRLLRNATHIVLCEYMAVKLSSQYLISRDNIRVISNAAFLNEKNIKNHPKSGKSSFVLGFFSNITAAKGCFKYIELVKAARENGLAVDGLMAGPVQAEIKSSFEKVISNVDFIKHVGAVYGEDKEQFFSQIDVLIFPTLYENEAEPVTILEAMMAGVPVISLSRGCINSMISDQVGWVITEQEQFVEQSLDKIRFLLANDTELQEMKVSAAAEFKRLRRYNGQILDNLILELMGMKNE